MKLIPTTLALILAPLALATQAAEVTITPFATYHWFESELDIEDKEGMALSLGYRFTPNVGVEVHYGLTEAETEGSLLSPSEDVDSHRLSLDALYEFNPEQAFSPYVLLGVGQLRLNPETEKTLRDTGINAGIGAFWHFNDNMALRLEARNVHNHDESWNDQLALVGLQFSLGGSDRGDTAAAEPAPQPAPVEQLAATPAPAPAAVVAAPADSDGDGVPDAQDSCSNSPAGAKVDANGCPLDSDKDGVADHQDKCPDTKAGATVDSSGCYEMLKQEVAIDLNIQFASGKAEIQGDARSEIQRVADFMQKYPNVNVTIEGHTDNRGNPTKNKQLSQTRAEAVKTELVKLGVEPARLNAVGYGADRPIADNNTEAGRAKNRRVVATAKAQSESIKMKQ